MKAPQKKTYWKILVIGSVILLLALVAGKLWFSAQGVRSKQDVTSQIVQAKQMAQPPSATLSSIDSLQARRDQLLARQRLLQGPDGWTWFTGLPGHRLVIFYGNPLSPVMGPIGRYDDQELIARLHTQSDAYAQLDPTHPVIPALDYVSPIAQPVPMDDNSWTYRMPDDSIEHYRKLANDNHALFFLDMQIGHSPIQKEVNALWKYVQQPGVDLALDPEFDMPPGGIPSQVFGRMYASEINWTIHQLSQLVQTQHLPPKVLVIHQFLEQMLPDWQKIKLEPGVEVVTCVDGFGDPKSKIGDYDMFNDVQRIQYPGMKLFYALDKPLMDPNAVLALKPSPLLVMYQ